jgi:transcriptional regulator with XRE-family HTH domain
VPSPAHPTAHGAQRNVTLADVARAAGVGKSTVSNMLNGSGRVGEAARAGVLETVDHLGYRQIEDGQDTEPGEIVATWLRERESRPVHR